MESVHCNVSGFGRESGRSGPTVQYCFNTAAVCCFLIQKMCCRVANLHCCVLAILNTYTVGYGPDLKGFKLIFSGSVKKRNLNHQKKDNSSKQSIYIY